MDQDLSHQFSTRDKLDYVNNLEHNQTFNQHLSLVPKKIIRPWLYLSAQRAQYKPMQPNLTKIISAQVSKQP